MVVVGVVVVGVMVMFRASKYTEHTQRIYANLVTATNKHTSMNQTQYNLSCPWVKKYLVSYCVLRTYSS